MLDDYAYPIELFIFLFVVLVLPASIAGVFLMFKKPGAPSQFGPSPQGKWPASAVLTVWRKSFHFKGRASRSEFWWYFTVGTLTINCLVGMVFIANQQLSGWVEAVCLLPGIAVSTRRLHDIGRSGWWQLLVLTGLGFLILLVMWLLPSPQEEGADVAQVFE